MTPAATLSLDEAAVRAWDVVVIGAGPAGALAARQAARHGARTLLVERKAFPRGKVCGACLNQAALSVLESAGLSTRLAGLAGQPLRSFQLQCGSQRLCTALPGGLAVSRSRLDAALAQAAVDSGAMFLPETAARVAALGSGAEGEFRLVQLNASSGGSGAVRARVVLAADGLGHSCLEGHAEFDARVHPRSRIGMGRTFIESPGFYRPGTIYMAVGTGGYVGLVQVEAGRLNVAAAIDPDFLKQHATASSAIAAILTEANMPVPCDPDEGGWQGTLPLTRHSRRLAGRRILLLGDAAGYVEPFTGEGMAWAFSAAVAAGPIVRRGLCRWEASLEREWSQVMTRAVMRRQRWCGVFSALLRHPRASRWLMAALSWAPQATAAVVRGLNAAPRSLERASP